MPGSLQDAAYNYINSHGKDLHGEARENILFTA